VESVQRRYADITVAVCCLLACCGSFCDGGVECKPANFRGQVVTNGSTLIRFVITLAPPSGSSYIAGIMTFNTATNGSTDFLPLVSINSAAYDKLSW